MNGFWIVFEFLLCAAEAFFACYLFSVYLGCREGMKKWHYVIIILALAGIMLGLTLKEIFELRTGISIFLIFAFCFFCFNSNIKMKVVFTIIYFIILTIADLFAISSAGLLFGVQNWDHMMLTSVERIGMAISAKTIHFLLIWIFSRFKKDHYQYLPRAYWVAFSVTFLFAFIGNFMLFKIGFSGNISAVTAMYILIAIIALTAVEIAVYITFDQICLYFKKLSDNKMIGYQRQAIQQYMQQKEDFDGHIRKMWHDMKHQLTYIRSLADGGKDEILQYIDKIYESFEDVSKIITTGDKIADVVINQKYTLAHKAQIQFDFKGHIEEGHEIRQPDLCALLCNALDNAIEASVKEVDHTKRYVEVVVKKIDHNLFIHVMNNISEKPTLKGNRLISDKSDKDIHGIGMLSMNSIVKKYRGNLIYAIEDDKFALNIMMDVYGV